jgi:hypothetical protein
MSEEWPVQRADALVCINMIHITPWAACKGLMTGAERTLRSGGILYLYGPYQIDGRHTAQSNEDFDAWLRTQNAQWGVRDIAEVTALAQHHAFSQGKFTHTFEGAAPQTGGPGTVWSQPGRQVHDDKCEEGGDCIIVVYFHGKLDFKPVHIKAQ